MMKPWMLCGVVAFLITGVLGLARPAGAQETPFPSYKGEIIHVKLRVLQLTDDDGNAYIGYGNGLTHAMTSADVAKTVEAINRDHFNQAGIIFDYDNTVAVPVIRDSALFRGMDKKPIDLRNKAVVPRMANHQLAYLPWALGAERGILVIVRRGSTWRWDNKAGQWTSIRDGSHGNPESVKTVTDEPKEWAHELGHLLGLPHTHSAAGEVRPGYPDAAAVQAAIDRYRTQHPDRNPIEAIDGDWSMGIRDTAPDPGHFFWRQGYWQDTLKLRLNGPDPENVYVVKVNMMGGNGGHFFSRDQVEVMRSNARFWVLAGDKFPLNNTPPGTTLYAATRQNVVVTPPAPLKTGTLQRYYGGQSFVEVPLPVGAKMVMTITPPVPGHYRVSFVGTRGLDHAAVTLAVTPTCTRALDFWSGHGNGELSALATRFPSGVIPIGECDLQAVPCHLTLTATGKARMSLGESVGLGGVILERLGEAQTVITGRIKSVSATEILLSAETVTLPDGKTITLKPTRDKRILFDAGVALPSGLQAGDPLRVGGVDSGPGKPLTAASVTSIIP